MGIERVENVLDTVHIEGWWGLPEKWENSSSRCYGRLTFEEDGVGELYLAGQLSSTKEIGYKYPVIWGEYEGGRKITIFDAQISKYHESSKWSSTLSTTLSFFKFWNGDNWFKAPSDILLKEFYFGINNLEVWHDLNCFSHVIDECKNILMNYNRPDQLSLYNNDEIEISVVYLTAGLHSEVAQTNIGLEHSARIVIRAKHGRIPFFSTDSYKGVKFYYDLMCGLFSILIGKSTISFYHYGLIDIVTKSIADLKKEFPQQADNINKPYEFPLEIEYHWNRTITDSQLKKLDIRRNVLFPFFKIQAELKEIVNGWINNGALFSHFWGGFKSFRNQSDSFTPHTLPELIYIFEGLHQKLHPELDKEAGKKKKELLAACPKDIKDNCSSMIIGWASLSQRLKVAFAEYEDIFPFISKHNQEKLASMISKIRNNVAHGKKADQVEFGFIFDLARMISLLIASMFMTTSGMSRIKIYECLSATQEYKEIKNTFLRYFSRKDGNDKI